MAEVAEVHVCSENEKSTVHVHTKVGTWIPTKVGIYSYGTRLYMHTTVGSPKTKIWRKCIARCLVLRAHVHQHTKGYLCMYATIVESPKTTRQRKQLYSQKNIVSRNKKSSPAAG